MKLSKKSISLLSDNELLAQYLSNKDMILLGELYNRHSEMVYYVCLRYLKDIEKSKDAVIHIFEILNNKINNQQIHDFPKWLYVVTKNHCLMDLRSKKQKSVILTNDFVQFESLMHPSENYMDKESQLSKLDECVKKLPEKQRLSINLFFMEQKCYKEVSELTGYNLNEVKSYIQNGKRNLKNCMEKDDE